MTWDPDQYAKFAAERALPFHDLLALLKPLNAPRVIDLGCGPGDLTRQLHERLGARETLGLDSSREMLERAAGQELPGRTADRDGNAVGGVRGSAGPTSVNSGLVFRLGDLRNVPPGEPYDLVFSHATLQWVPDHPTVLARLAALLGQGGQLAIQVPANQDHPSHTVAAAVAAETPFAEALRAHSVHVPDVLPPERYADLLYRLGFIEQRVQMVVYTHLLPGPAEVVEWVKGTLLTAWRSALPEALYAEFLERYQARLLALLPAEAPFFYAFKRILIWGRKG